MTEDYPGLHILDMDSMADLYAKCMLKSATNYEFMMLKSSISINCIERHALLRMLARRAIIKIGYIKWKKIYDPNIDKELLE